MELLVIDLDTAEPLAVIDSFVEVEWWRRLSTPGDVKVKMETFDLAGTYVDIDRGLWVPDTSTGGGHLFLVEKIEVDTASTLAAVEITGRDVIGAFMDHRWVEPAAGLSHDEITDNVETVLYHFVNANLGPGASAARKLANLVMGTDLGRGEVVSQAGRHQVLGEFVAEIAKAYGFGWDVVWDRASNEFEFQVIAGEDRTSTVYIDPEFETAQSIRWLRSRVASKNVARVAGQGEGELRDLEDVWTEATEPTGYNRREVFVDARDLADPLLLPDRGVAALGETAEEDTFQVVVAPQGSFEYPTDFDLGDTVTVRSAVYNLERAAQVVSVGQKTGSEDGGTTTTTIEVGQSWPTLRRRVREMAARPGSTGRS